MSLHAIVFDYLVEILTSIFGYFGSVLFMGPTVLMSLIFQATRRNYGPYGDKLGTFISSKLIVKIHVRKGWYVDAIGVHVFEGQDPKTLLKIGYNDCFFFCDLQTYRIYANQLIKVCIN